MITRKEHSIGVFDSGLGGLTVLRELQQALPNEKMIYFGDTARVPYGGKSPETLIRYSIENSLFLLEKHLKMLVVACNAASSYSVDKLQRIFNIPVIGVIEPGAQKAVEETKNGHIAVLGTKATINSGVYQKAIHKRLPEAKIFSIACPLLVPLVEEKWLEHPVTKLVLNEYLKELDGVKIDTVVLACTHYPVLKNLMQEALGSHIAIVDSASTCAEEVVNTLSKFNLKNDQEFPAFTKFFVSDDPDKFKLLGKDFLGKEIEEVELASSFKFL